MTEKPRVFVSSVMNGYGHMREAARKGIAAAGCEPVLVEDFPALSASPRNACLDGVATSEAVVVVLGARGGTTGPSGKLIVQEEYDYARGKSIHPFVFLENVPRDVEAQGLEQHLSDFTSGSFRRSFSSAQELSTLVSAALQNLPPLSGGPMDVLRFAKLLATPMQVLQSEPVLRVVVAPGRQNETVVPVETLDDESFRSRLVAAGVAQDVALFHRNHPRSENRGQGSLIVQQHGPRQQHVGLGEFVRVELTEDGWLVIDVNVTGNERGLAAFFQPLEVENVEKLARAALLFTAKVYADVDPFRRHLGLLCNASLSLEGRPLLLHRDVKPQSGGVTVRLPNRQAVGPATSFDRPERISRAATGWPQATAAKLARRLERRVNTTQ